MLRQNRIGALVVLMVLAVASVGAKASDETKYPDWKGQWIRLGGIQWDPTKPLGRAEQPPLTAEYQAIFEAGLARQAAGGQGNDPTYTCIPPGMPRTMTVVYPMEILVTPETTYVMIEYAGQLRRIYTDGRDWPETLERSFIGYSIGKWIDEDGDGRYDTLTVETRGMKGPRTFDASGIPLHGDNETVVKERIFLDKTNPNVLHNMITVIDHALTRPWTVDKTYRRNTNPRPPWREFYCIEGNVNIVIGKENYFLSADGLLMPAKKEQAPPDLRYFPWVKK